MLSASESLKMAQSSLPDFAVPHPIRFEGAISLDSSCGALAICSFPLFESLVKTKPTNQFISGGGFCKFLARMKLLIH
jgi:hypothetical protein